MKRNDAPPVYKFSNKLHAKLAFIAHIQTALLARAYVRRARALKVINRVASISLRYERIQYDNDQPSASHGAFRYELWQQTIDASLKDSRWHEYDCDLQRIVAGFNRHLSGKSGYFPLDWRIIKAIIWTESGGPSNSAWRSNPMQIGNAGDPGLAALMSGKEGGDLIMPADLKRTLTTSSVRSSAQMNIFAGTA